MLEEIGIFSILILLLIILILPLVLTVIVGVAFANMLGLSGIVWWSFVILFYIVIAGILGTVNNT